MHSYHFLPYEIQRRTGKSKSDELHTYANHIRFYTKDINIYLNRDMTSSATQCDILVPKSAFVWNCWGSNNWSHLMNEHQHDACITPSISGKEREGIRMSEELVTKGPVDSSSRWKGQGEHIEGCIQINVLKLLRLPHCMHDLPGKSIP